MKAVIDIDVKAMDRKQIEAYAKDPKNSYIVAVPILLILSFIFYVIAGFFSYLGGGASSSETAIQQTILTGVSDSNAADTFKKIQMALRVMPSHQTEGNMLIMTPVNGDAEWQAEYDGDFSGSITEDYYTTDSMEDYFPEMHFNENTVPLGNAKPFCMHLDWSTKANKKMLDKYYGVQDMPLCSLAQNPKFRWQDADPKDGLDFTLWKQFSKKVSSADDCESNSIFVKSMTQNGGTCYHYEVIESICVGVQFTVNEESATYGWSYTGGCFEDGRIVNYKPAVPGTDYAFDKLDFEIREYNSGLAGSLGSIFSLSGLFGLLSTICIFGAIVAVGILIFKHFKEKKEGQNSGVERSQGGNVEMNNVRDKEKHQAFADEQ